MTTLAICGETEDQGGGKYRLTQHLRPICYDDAGTIRRIDTEWKAGDATFAHAVEASQMLTFVTADGTRRICPTRDERVYIEIGAPFVKGGLGYEKIALPTAARASNDLKWETADMALNIVHGGHYVKMELELTGEWRPADGIVAFPIALSGLKLDGNKLLLDDKVVSMFREPIVYDKARLSIDNPERDNLDYRLPIKWDIADINGIQHIVYTLPDISGMRTPVIDPTLTVQPDATAGVDALMRNGIYADTNYATDITLNVKEAAGVDYQRRSVLKFDLSSLPSDCTVNSVAMYGYWDAGSYNNPTTISLYECLRNWVEAQVTWNVYSTGNSWTSGGCQGSGTDYSSTLLSSDSVSSDPGDDGERVYATSTNFVTYITAHRAGTANFVLHSATDANYVIHSSDYTTASLRPKLVVNYTEAAAGQPAHKRFAGFDVQPFGGVRVW